MPPAALLRPYRRSVATGNACWRVVPPKYAHTPLSTVGAETHGGRWNRRGEAALYLSEPFNCPLLTGPVPVATAWAEYQQDIGSRIGTLIPYDVDLAATLDLTESAMIAALALNADDFLCAWKLLRMNGAEPPTWAIADRARALGAQAVRVPSAIQPGGVNIVIFVTDVVRAVDPTNALPINQASWPAEQGPNK